MDYNSSLTIIHMYTKNDNRKQAMVPEQLQKKILEENHSGIIHVLIYQNEKFHIIITILNYIVIKADNQYNNNIAYCSTWTWHMTTSQKRICFIRHSIQIITLFTSCLQINP